MANFVDLVRTRVETQRKRNKVVLSPHDGHSKIMEEVHELAMEVYKKEKRRSNLDMLNELIDIAAICQGMAEDLELVTADLPEKDVWKAKKKAAALDRRR